jgi:O-antigen/teichoic acid export membrane protein
MGIYCALIAILAGPMVQVFLGDDYMPYAWLVGVYALYYALTYLSVVASIVLKSMEITAPIFLAQALSAAVVLSAGVAAVKYFGLVGAGIGLVVNAIMINAVLWTIIRRHTKHHTVEGVKEYPV